MPEVELHTAIAKAEAGDWIDPVDEPIHWYAGRLGGNWGRGGFRK
jgi:hypothetical protein